MWFSFPIVRGLTVSHAEVIDLYVIDTVLSWRHSNLEEWPFTVLYGFFSSSALLKRQILANYNCFLCFNEVRSWFSHPPKLAKQSATSGPDSPEENIWKTWQRRDWRQWVQTKFANKVSRPSRLPMTPHENLYVRRPGRRCQSVRSAVSKCARDENGLNRWR
jgi:hypothetical protein